MELGKDYAGEKGPFMAQKSCHSQGEGLHHCLSGLEILCVVDCALVGQMLVAE